MMSKEPKLKFKFNPTPTLAKLYEQQGLYQDAIRVYSYLHETGKYDYSQKIIDLRALSDPKLESDNEQASLSEILITQKKEVEVFSKCPESDNCIDYDEIGTQKTLLLPEYKSLINLLFTDEEKTQFKIVPSDDFYYNKNNQLVSIFSNSDDNGNDTENKDKMNDISNSDYEEILDSSENINPEVTVEDFVNILFTYYDKNTKISEIKIGDLFLLLSSIKLENN